VSLLAVLIAAWCALGSVIFGNTAQSASDLLRFLKIFGLPSIIPLSICLASRFPIRQTLVASAVLSLSFNVVVPFTGYQDKLPLFTQHHTLSEVQTSRPSGAVSNPNEYAYMSLAGLAFAMSWWLGNKRPSIVSRPLCAVAVVVAVYGVVSSGSRSGIVGLFCGFLYYVLKGKASAAKRASLVGVLLLAMAVGWQISDVFRKRMGTALAERSQEINFVGRVEAQTVAIRTWAAWPLGVGFSNMPEATTPYAWGTQWVTAVAGSDSIYVDFLLGAGIGGFTFLLFCLGNCWKLATAMPLDRRGAALRGGIVGILCCGFASLAPATVFVAPFFFALVGLSALPIKLDRETRLPGRTPPHALSLCGR
jgi:O-antigen ligase